MATEIQAVKGCVPQGALKKKDVTTVLCVYALNIRTRMDGNWVSHYVPLLLPPWVTVLNEELEELQRTV